MLTKTIRTYFTIVFIYELFHSAFYATYVLFLTKTGLSLLEVNLINICFMISGVLLEVPTGAIADQKGRKFSFIAACFTLALSFFAYSQSHSFWQFVLCEVIGALGMALYSGAFEAWLVDSIKFYDRRYEMNRIFERSLQLKQLGIIIGGVTGAQIGKYSLAWPWLISSAGMILVGVVSWFIMKEEYFDQTQKKEPLWQTTRESWRYSRRHPEILYLAALSTIYGFACAGPNMYWQIKFKSDFALSVETIGWIFAGIIISLMLGARWHRRLKQRFPSDKHSLSWSLFIFSLGLIIASFSSTLLVCFSGFYLHEFARGAYEPLKKDWINTKIVHGNRATILSLNEMAGKLGGGIGLLASGLIASRWSIDWSWGISAFLVILGLGLLNRVTLNGK